VNPRFFLSALISGNRKGYIKKLGRFFKAIYIITGLIPLFFLAILIIFTILYIIKSLLGIYISGRPLLVFPVNF